MISFHRAGDIGEPKRTIEAPEPAPLHAPAPEPVREPEPERIG